MQYQLIEPPFNLRLEDPIHLQFKILTKEQAREYFDWFVKNIPVRVAILRQSVVSTEGYGDWAPDLTLSSLSSLGNWFKASVDTRVKAMAEIQEIRASGPDWFQNIEIDNWDLSPKTYSICYDIGMYFAQVIQSKRNDLTWEFVTKPPSNINVNQPVLKSSRQTPLNPVQVMSTAAFGLVRETKDGDVLVNLYKVWLKTL